MRKLIIYAVLTRIAPLNLLMVEEEGKHVISMLTHAAIWYIPLNTVDIDVKQSQDM